MTGIIDRLNQLALHLMTVTGERGIKRLVLEADFALRIGILPGRTMTINTAVGPVEVVSDAPVVVHMVDLDG